ncbi:MAG: RNA methyltransferase [Planctomycetes bacterium]|nr:RNA methyltransferase [Planctomycetota bacterium]
MVERSRRGKRKHKQPSLLGSHARSWIWGRNLVRDTLAVGRWPILELYLSESLPPDQLAEACARGQTLGIPLQIVPREVVDRLGQTSEHQGYLAKVGAFPYATAADLLDCPPAHPLFLILDAIQDPYNFGAMLRSAAAFSVTGVFIGTERQVAVTSMVARSSAGVINRVPIAQVADLVSLTKTLNERGIPLIGASEKATETLTDCDFL